jgi:hypothetical protein
MLPVKELRATEAIAYIKETLECQGRLSSDLALCSRYETALGKTSVFCPWESELKGRRMFFDSCVCVRRDVSRLLPSHRSAKSDKKKRDG